jgi:hypothetical protein
VAEETWLVEGVVFRDVDRDGQRGGGEPGMAGIRVVVRNENASWVSSTVTDGEGRYSFRVQRGRYVVWVAHLPTGYFLTTPGEVVIEVPRMLATDSGLAIDFGARWRFLVWLLGTLLGMEGAILAGLVWTGTRVRPAIVERHQERAATAKKRREMEVAAWVQENGRNSHRGGNP